MTGSKGLPIDNNDYNGIRSKVAAILGSGVGNRGYGQTLYSSDVPTNPPPQPQPIIRKSHWDSLRFDLLTIKYHQDGVLPSIVQVQVGDPIRYGPGSPNTDYDILADQADINRFALATSQSLVSTGVQTSRTGDWHAQSTSTVTVLFTDANLARYFFNSGGKIRFTSSLAGGYSTDQNVSWINLLTAVGTQGFSATGSVNFYTLTDSYQTFYSYVSTLYYGGNEYRIEAKCNVPNNSSGGATQLTFKITWYDNFVDRKFPPRYPDNVGGTLTLIVDEVKAAGQTFPTGTFSVLSPSYSITPITAS